jgi:hypothetical protein
VLGVITLVLLESRLRVTYRTELSGCAHENGTGGGSSVFRWADRIGIPVRLLDSPVWEASRALASPTGNCILTIGDGSWSPTGENLDKTSWVITREWIARGNTLIIVTSEPQALPADLKQDLIPASISEVDEHHGFLDRGRVESRPEANPAPVTTGGTMEVEANGPRWIVSKSPAATPATTAKNAPKSTPESEVATWQLAADARGGVLFRIPVGQGAVYVLLDSIAWTNSGLDQGDNARVLAGVLDREVRAGGVLAFDEYRHGHGRAESFLVYLANLPGSTALFWLALSWAALYYYGRNVRLKPVEAFLERERRTAQEYIDAVAQLYERARAAPLVVEAVARRLRQLSRSAAQSLPEVDALLQTADDYVKKAERPVSPTAGIVLVKQLIQLRKKIYGTRAAS